MTGGQAPLSLDPVPSAASQVTGRALDRTGLELIVIPASDEELTAHERQLDVVAKACPEGAIWRRVLS
jgi:hypothetical protein